MGRNNNPTHEISRILDRAGAAGRGRRDIFCDWLEFLDAHYDALHCLAVGALHGEPNIILPEIEQRKAKALAPYAEHRRDYYSGIFIKATDKLIEMSAGDYRDVLGEIYMDFVSNGANGQFFTPMNIARMMASIGGAGDNESVIRERMSDAIEKSPAAQGRLLASLAMPSHLRHDYFLARVYPLMLPHYRPLTVYDPTVGSGVMLLAAAISIPTWMTHLGLVQFYGQDIDQTCVRMAQLNTKIYGLDGRLAPIIVFQAEQRLIEAGIVGEPRPDLLETVIEALFKPGLGDAPDDEEMPIVLDGESPGDYSHEWERVAAALQSLVSVNGAANGRVNGHSNGHSNGRANGRVLIPAHEELTPQH